MNLSKKTLFEFVALAPNLSQERLVFALSFLKNDIVSFKFTTVIILFLIFSLPNSASFLISIAKADSAQKMKIKEEEIRQNMIVISRQLGVTCTECHNMKKLSDDSLKNFQVARDHMKVVEMLKANGMDGKKGPEASCYMCHRGQIKIPYKEKANSL